MEWGTVAVLFVAFDLLVGDVGRSGKVSEAFRSQALKPLGLCQKNRPQPFANLALADNPRQSGDGAGTPGDTNVGVFALGKDVRGNNAPLIIWRQKNSGGHSRDFLVEHSLERGFGNDL